MVYLVAKDCLLTIQKRKDTEQSLNNSQQKLKEAQQLQTTSP